MGLSALLGSPPMALLQALRASMEQHRHPRPCWTSPPPPDEGAGAHTGPPKGTAPSRSCSPPLVPAGTVVPLPSPEDAPHDGGCNSAAPPCAPWVTCMLGLVLVAHSLHGALRLPPSLSPRPLHPPLWGGGVAPPPPPCGCGWCTPHGGGSRPTCAAMPAAPNPLSLSLTGGLASSCERLPLPLPPHCHPPSAKGPAALVEPPPPPKKSCPLLHQPGGDALKNIEQPLGGGRGGWDSPPRPCPCPCPL